MKSNFVRLLGKKKNNSGIHLEFDYELNFNSRDIKNMKRYSFPQSL